VPHVTRCILLAVRPVLFLVVSFSLLGCGGALRSAKKTVGLGSDLVVHVTVDSSANQNSAVALDVVNIENKKVADSILTMSSSDWFKKKLDLQRTYPKDLVVSSWEWVPGQVVGSVKIRNSRSAKAVVLFASYLTPGEHRAVLPGHGTVSVNLLEKDFALSTAN
jgi:type VI secretion system protein